MRATHLVVLLVLVVLALGLTYPLVTQLTTHVPGSDTWAYDEYTFLWNIWWFKHALIDQHISPLQTDLLFYPLGLDLVLYTFNFMAAALALPLHLAMASGLDNGVPLASNLVNLASSVLGGYGAFLLARYLLRNGVSQQQSLQSVSSRDYGLARDLAALLAGLIYAFASSRSLYLALGHYMIVTTQWVPFFALYFLRTQERLRTRDAALAGLFAGLALYTDMLYGVLLALIALSLLLAAGREFWQRQAGGAAGRRAGGSIRLLSGRLLVMAAVAALFSSLLLIPTIREGLRADYAVEGWGHAEKLSADLVGLVTPTDLHPLWGVNQPAGESGQSGWAAALRAVETGESRFSDIRTVFLGYVTLALAIVGTTSALRAGASVIGRRRARGWLAIALIAGVLALGPVLQVNGQSRFDLDGLTVNVPLPFIILHYLPFVEGFRAPSRFSIVLMLALAVLASFGLAWLLVHVFGLRDRLEGRVLLPHGRSSSRRAAGLILAIFLMAAVLFEHLSVPIPLTDARVPAAYQFLAEQPGDFALMQLPMGWRNGFGVFGSEDTRVEWYSSVHQRPILSGNTSRNPPIKFEYFQRQPLLQAITGSEMYQPPDERTDRLARQSAAELVGLWDVRYLVVNPPVDGRYPYADTWEAARDYALDVLPVNPQPLWDEAGVQIYAVRQPPAIFPFRLDFGTQNSNAYRGPGWSVDERDIGGVTGIWATGQEAEIFLPLRLNQPNPVQLTLRIQPFDYPGAPPQAVTVELNGVALGTRALPAGWQDVRFDVPAKATRQGLNRLWLRFAKSARPVDVLPGQGQIGGSGVRSPVDMEINSGGAAQDLAFISVTGAAGQTEDASAGRRGYNLAVLDPKNGKILDVRGFDTWANEFEADRLAEFIEGLPIGVIVLAAVRDDASRFLNDRAVAALASLGSQVDLRQSPGYGHALIGVKGAAPGTVLESNGPDGAFLRLAVDRRPLAAALDWLHLEAGP